MDVRGLIFFVKTGNAIHTPPEYENAREDEDVDPDNKEDDLVASGQDRGLDTFLKSRILSDSLTRSLCKE